MTTNASQPKTGAKIRLHIRRYDPAGPATAPRQMSIRTATTLTHSPEAA